MAAERLAQLARPILWCQATDPIREVARRIGAGAHSCALVRVDGGLGIVTDRDFRRRVATGEVGVDAPVSALVTVPALTIDERVTESAVLLRMVEHAVHQLVVTDRAGAPIGVVRAVDLAQGEVRDPLRARMAIENATTLDEVAQAARLLPATVVALCDSQVAALHVGAVHAAVVDAIIRRVLRLHPGFPGVRQSWLVLGSLARRDSLPRSDVDTRWSGPTPRAPIRARSGPPPAGSSTTCDAAGWSRARTAPTPTTGLLDLNGIGPVSAARILGDVADVARFATRARFASWNGTAPLEASSGEQRRHRLSRAGNRRINRAPHIMAIVQIRHDTPGRAYFHRRVAAGKTKMEALRALKRRLSDVVYRQLVADAAQAASPGGQVEATTTSCAADPTPTVGSSDQSQPGLTAKPTAAASARSDDPTASASTRRATSVRRSSRTRPAAPGQDPAQCTPADTHDEPAPQRHPTLDRA